MQNLRVFVEEALAALALRGGIERVFGDRVPWIDLDAQAAFNAGMLEGVAVALDLTVFELLDELGLRGFSPAKS